MWLRSGDEAPRQKMTCEMRKNQSAVAVGQEGCSEMVGLPFVSAR